jgi:hypothetical protein
MVGVAVSDLEIYRRAPACAAASDLTLTVPIALFALGVEARLPGVQIGKVEARVEIDLTHPVGNQALTELD